MREARTRVVALGDAIRAVHAFVGEFFLHYFFVFAADFELALGGETAFGARDAHVVDFFADALDVVLEHRVVRVGHALAVAVAGGGVGDSAVEFAWMRAVAVEFGGGAGERCGVPGALPAEGTLLYCF